MQEQARSRRYDQTIKRIHLEIVPNYIDGCIHWVDTLYEDAWLKATQKFERGVIKYLAGRMREMDYTIEEELLFSFMNEYMEKYLKYKKLDERESFIKSLTKEKKYEY